MLGLVVCSSSFSVHLVAASRCFVTGEHHQLTKDTTHNHRVGDVEVNNEVQRPALASAVNASTPTLSASSWLSSLPWLTVRGKPSRIQLCCQRVE